MFLGLDGVEIGLIIVFLCLFGGIISGFPVAFALGGSGLIAFGILAALDGSGLLVHEMIDTGSNAYATLRAQGVPEIEISKFSYPDLPRVSEALFPGGWELAMDRNLAFLVNRMNERVFAGAGIETLLAVLMFVMMGITLERSKIANELLTTMARVFGPLPGGLAVSVVVVGAFLAASTGIVGATVVTMGLLSLPTMLRNGYSPELSTGVIAASGTLGQIIPPSIVIVLLGTLAGDLYSQGQEVRAAAAGCSDALTYLGKAAVLSVGTLFQAAMLPGILLAVLYGVYAFGYAMVFPHKAPPVRGEARAPGMVTTRAERLSWYLGVPGAIILAAVLAGQTGLIGSQTITVDSFTDAGQTASLRVNVPGPVQGQHDRAAWPGGLGRRHRRTGRDRRRRRGREKPQAQRRGTDRREGRGDRRRRADRHRHRHHPGDAGAGAEPRARCGAGAARRPASGRCGRDRAGLRRRRRPDRADDRTRGRPSPSSPCRSPRRFTAAGWPPDGWRATRSSG